jgi:hypothetical protein
LCQNIDGLGDFIITPELRTLALNDNLKHIFKVTLKKEKHNSFQKQKHKQRIVDLQETGAMVRNIARNINSSIITRGIS